MNFFYVFRETFSIWWKRPHMKPFKDHDHRQASWLELFFDLVFVAALAELSQMLLHSFQHSLHMDAFFKFILVFISVWVIWRAITFYCDRYEENTVRHRLLMFVMMIPVGLMAFGVSGVEKNDFHLFFYTFIASRLFMIYLWVTVEYQSKEQRAVHSGTIYTFLVSTLLISGAFFMTPIFIYITWSFALILELFHPLLSISKHQKMPSFTRTHLPERFGLFIILVLGESVLAIIHGSKEVEFFTAELIMTILLAMVIVFMLWWIYFDHVIYRLFKNSMYTVLFWGVLNLPIAISLILVRTSLVEVLTSGDRIVPEHFIWLCVGSVSLFLICVAVIGLLSDHGGEHSEYRLLPYIDRVYVVTKVGSAGVLMIFPIFIQHIHAWYLLLVISIVLGINLIQGLYIWLKSSLGE